MTRLGILVALLAAACGETTNTAITQLNLDRPIDVTFACYGGLRLTHGGAADISQDVQVSAQPIESCNLRSADHPDGTDAPVPPGQEDLQKQGGAFLPGVSWYALILQSTPGTVAVASFDPKPSRLFSGGNADVHQQDVDNLTPGENGITVGENPVGIVTDKLGCYAVTANAGSCDLSALDITTALDNTPGARVDRIQVTNASGQPILARPAAIVAEPPGGTIGNACPAQPTGLVYVAYPSCHLVAAIDTSNGKIVGGVQFDAAGTPTLLANGNVTCPDECGGGTIMSGTRPVTVDVEFDDRVDRRVMAIGADNSNVLTVMDLDATTVLPTGAPQRVVLENTTGTLGVSHVAISPQIGMGGSAGMLNDAAPNQFTFLYAVASDGTVRVADILNLYKECDTQTDPRFLTTEKSIARLSCIRNDDPTKPPRRPGARGPGIELAPWSASNNPIATSIDVVKVDAHDGDIGPGKLVGYFGIISSDSGATYLLNVDDDDWPDVYNANDPLNTMIPLDIANQLRDSTTNRGDLAETQQTGSNGQPMEVPTCDDPGPDPDSGANIGGPRAPTPPQRVLPAGVIAAEKISQLPYIRQVKCVGVDEPNGKAVSELAFAAPVPVRDLEFPDVRGLRGDETWTLNWEGSLSLDRGDQAVDGPAVREAQVFVDGAGMRIDDQSRPFCDAGVEAGDIVRLNGCDPALENQDCPLGYVCYVHPNSQIAGQGSCMLTDEADRLANACKEFLVSVRRFTVGKSKSGELTLVPRRHALDTTPLDGCSTDQQCQSLAKYSLTRASGANPIDDKTMDDPHTWACVADNSRPAPVKPGGSGKWCEQTCTDDTSCGPGTVCQAGFCMEGVIPPQACVNAPQKFELRAHDAFVMIGNRSGYVHSMIADTGGACVRDPNANPWLVSRIPLWAPDCAADADPRTGKRPDGTFEPNPCMLTVDHTENEPQYMGGTCANPTTVLATRQATALRLRRRGMTLTMVDPTYPGDAVCLGDRGGGLVNVPMIGAGYQVNFRQASGFSPLLLGIAPALPVKVLRGPQDSMWVVDEGDFLSQSLSQPSTRGKVYRIESTDVTKVNVVQ